MSKIKKASLFGDTRNKIRTFAIISPENSLGFENSDEEELKLQVGKQLFMLTQFYVPMKLKIY